MDYPRSRTQMAEVASAVRENLSPLELVGVCGGHYECPKDAAGKRLGPLVGYNGRDELGRQYVGDIYVNFAAAERFGSALSHIARLLNKRIEGHWHLAKDFDGYCGAPEGGKALATALALLEYKQYIFPEKKVTAVATPDSREKAELIFSRHEPAEGERWVIVEDVCNNFSTTSDLVSLIEERGARCVGIVCFLNRSDKFSDIYTWEGRRFALDLPIVSLVKKHIPQYKQDDHAVAADVVARNVVWKPKNEWDRLAAAMK